MLKTIDLTDIKDYWKQISPYIHKTALKTNSRWTHEDVYLELMTERSTLYIEENESGIIGFVILNKFFQYGDIILNIWLAVNINSDNEDTLYACDEIKDIAYKINAKYITFVSSRKGFSKLNEKTGFNEETINYIYEV